jgi:hypothetical protein
MTLQIFHSGHARPPLDFEEILAQEQSLLLLNSTGRLNAIPSIKVYIYPSAIRCSKAENDFEEKCSQ